MKTTVMTNQMKRVTSVFFLAAVMAIALSSCGRNLFNEIMYSYSEVDTYMEFELDGQKIRMEGVPVPFAADNSRALSPVYMVLVETGVGNPNVSVPRNLSMALLGEQEETTGMAHYD